MSHNKILPCVLLFLSLTTYVRFVSAQDKANYKAKFPEKWGEVDEYVRARWDNELSKSDEIPYIYITAWPQLPFMFYWDAYFANKGLLLHKYDMVAKWNTQSLLFAVDKFGFVGNAFVSDWGMNRSQPPYLSAQVRDYFEQTGSKDTALLRQAFPLLKKEYLFWTDTSPQAIEQHNTSIEGLQRFYHHASEEEMLVMYKEIASRFNLPTNISDDEKIKVTIPYVVEAASGMDFTPRFEDRCQDFIPVELNTLLYVYEKNFAWLAKVLKVTGEPDWDARAERRKKLINQYCWDEGRGLYLDYDYVNKRRSKVASVITFQPLWAGIASKEQAAKVVKNMPLFESEWGMKTTEATNTKRRYQWGETSVWAPMQVLVVMALEQYGYKAEAKRIASKYLDLVTKNFLSPIPASYKTEKGIRHRENGKTYEKYKTDGTLNDDEYPCTEMVSWTGGAVAFCYDYLTTKK